jgi:hypothetical protein
MLIRISDPNNPNVYGALYSPDPVYYPAIKAGRPFNLLISTVVASDDVENLFDLSPPPSFSGRYMVWGRFDSNTGILVTYLATTIGDRSYPFADFRDFKAAVENGINGNESGSGSVYLNRPNALPINSNWDLSP